MKIIKFDLPIDGVKVKTVDELRDHFTLEMLAHARSGLLAKWLSSRKLQDELAAVKALDGAEDHALLKGLCEVFGVDIDDEIASAMLNKAPDKTEKTVNEQVKIYDDLAEIIDLAIYQAIRLNCITANRNISKDEEVEFNWAPQRDVYFKGDSFFDKTSDLFCCPPVACKIVEKITDDNQKLVAGDLVGWFIMPDSAEDYSGHWHVLLSILKHRQNILDLVSTLVFEKTGIALLKNSIDRRISVIQSVISIIGGYKLPKNGLPALLYSFLSIRIKAKEIEEFLQTAEKENVIEAAEAAEIEAVEMARAIIQARESLLESLYSLPADHRKIIFFNKNIKQTDIIMCGLTDNEGETIQLFIEVGDRIYTNDCIAAAAQTPIKSNATGIVRKVFVENESDVLNGTVLLRLETSSSHSADSFIQGEINKRYQKI